jgi:hypothetical protein
MQRREWLKLSVVAAGATALLGRALYSLRPDPTRVLTEWQRKVRAELDVALADYDVDSEALWQYLQDAERYRLFLLDGSSRRTDLASRFLLSTDFFEHGADPQRPARYVLFFHPWVRPCAGLAAARSGE